MKDFIHVLLVCIVTSNVAVFYNVAAVIVKKLNFIDCHERKRPLWTMYEIIILITVNDYWVIKNRRS